MSTTEILTLLPRMGAGFDGSTVVKAGIVAGDPVVVLADGRRIVGAAIFYL